MVVANVDPTARVDPHAELDETVVVGPFAVVEADVRLGPGTVLAAHAMVRRHTTLGRDNEVHPFAVIGGPPQDRRHDGTASRVVAGDGNVFREHVTVNGGSSHGGGTTRIGGGCLFMTASHVAHDCAVGDGVVMANATLLGGHVELGDHVVTGGQVAIAPFVRVGARAFLAGGAMVERDVPPFVIAAGDRARVRGLNTVGLERSGVSPASRAALAVAFRRIFRGEDPQKVAARRLCDDPDELVRTLARWIAER